MKRMMLFVSAKNVKRFRIKMIARDSTTDPYVSEWREALGICNTAN